MGKNTDRDWETWGRTDPYFGVLSHPQFRQGAIDEHRDEFWESGKRDIDGVIADYERIFGPLPKGSALDFGSGVGRLTLALGQRFESVVGLDISPSMLAESQRNAKLANVDNVSFELSDDALANAPPAFDFAVSIIVLQHIPVQRGLPIISRILDRIRPGGGCHLHMSVMREGGRARRAAYWVRDNVPGANQIMNLLVGRPIGQPGMQMNAYPLDRVFKAFQTAGMDRILVTLSDHGGVLTAAFSASKPKPGV